MIFYPISDILSSVETDKPNMIILAGPNGAGKTTCALRALPKELDTKHFINADLIAQGLSPFDPAFSEIDAGRLMLKRLVELSERRQNFAFESTLSSKYFRRFLKTRKEKGYAVHILYFWLSSPELAMSRVAARVAKGGHLVPEKVVKRRYKRSLENFVHHYIPLADTWVICDNSNDEPELIAMGKDGIVHVSNNAFYEMILKGA